MAKAKVMKSPKVKTLSMPKGKKLPGDKFPMKGMKTKDKC